MGAEKEKSVNGSTNGNDRFSPLLTINQRIWFLLLLPTAFCCIVYIVDIATDIALAQRHFVENRRFVGFLTLLLIYAPAIVFFALTIADQSKWPDPEKNTSKKAKWVLKQMVLLIFFPIHAIHRFAGKLFWSLEALMCSDLEKKEAMDEASKPYAAELYLLLQAFFQAAPQALLQTYILASFKIPHLRTGGIQFLSITTSIASVAIAASSYMRFESQKLAGRRTPWSVKNQTTEKSGLKSKMSLMTTIESQIAADTPEEKPPSQDEPAEVKLESPKQPQLPKGVPQSAILSLPPLPPQIRAKLIKASGDELPEDLQKEYNGSTLEGEPLNIRTSIYGSETKSPQTEKEIEDLSLELRPPQSLSPTLSLSDAPLPPSPCPLDIPLDEDTFDNDSENKAEENSLIDQPNETQSKMATASPSAEQSPVTERPTEEHMSREPLIDDSECLGQEKPSSPKHFQPIPLPTRKWKVKGLVEDDFLGKFIGFIWWFLFITSRVLALATLGFFYPWAFCAVLLVHYLGMIFYLFNCERSKDSFTTVFHLGLGFVYLLCFVEIRTRFKNPNTFTLIFIVVGVIENTLSSAAWYFFGQWTSWWFLYAFFFIITSMILSILSMGLYFLILKPPTQDIYTN